MSQSHFTLDYIESEGYFRVTLLKPTKSAIEGYFGAMRHYMPICIEQGVALMLFDMRAGLPSTIYTALQARDFRASYKVLPPSRSAILPPPSSKNSLLTMAARMVSTPNDSFSLFSNEEEALAWLLMKDN